MNLLRLIKILLSPKLSREIFLFMQMTVMIIFINTVIVPFEQERHLRNGLRQVFECNYGSIVHFNPNISYIDGDRSRIDVMIKNLSCSEKVSDVFLMKAVKAKLSRDREVALSDMLIYSESLFNNSDIELSCGSFDKYTGGDVLPIIVSDSLSDIFPLGAEFTTLFPKYGDLQTTCKVVGVMKPSAILPSINYYGSIPTLNALGIDMNASDSRNFIVAVECPITENIAEWEHSLLIVSDASQNFINELNNEYSDIGRFTSAEEIESISEKNILSQRKFNILMIVLFIPIVLFGYGGYILLMLRSRRREFGIFYILGISKARLTVINLIIISAISAASSSVGMLITPFVIKKYFKTNFAGYLFGNYVVLATAFLGVCIISLCISMLQTRNISASVMYKEVE